MGEKLQCDLVMRGGITSGIVYPRAIAKLAETYRFRSIGGTSAGAIAAAATAAAMYGTKRGGKPFEARFKSLPEELSDTENETKPTRLERLFQPQRQTRRLFRVLMSGLGRQNKALKIASIVGALCWNYWPFTLLGAVFGLVPVLAFALTSSIGGSWFWALLALGVVSGAVLMILAAAGGAIWNVFKALPKNGYGMCSGSDGPDAYLTDDPPLTDWLHKFFQDVAGRPIDQPLTFGQLWGNGEEEVERDIDLVLMTTNITRGVSQRFPFIEGSWGQLFFKEDEFVELFPPSIVAWMRKHAGEVRSPDRVDVPEGFFALPAPADLPILLGARMSLSFPFLLGAVPLYAANVAEKNENGKFPLQRCWFSDGGLTSNFPLHFFDSPLPSRPTFGINLVPASVKLAETDDEVTEVSRLSEGDDDPWSHIYMPRKNASGISSAARFNKFEGESGSVLGFFGALFDTARNWGDTELMAMPGYRDRIVHVKLSKDEGGMNLNMPKKIIDRVGARGEKAGKLLAARFASAPGLDPKSNEAIVLTWDNHRWIRYRSLMAGLELVVRRMRNAWGSGYAGLLDRAIDDAPSYKFRNAAQQEFARKATKCVLDAAGEWTGEATFDRYDGGTDGRSPRPKPALRMMPPGSNDPRTERAD
jgi:predicted acylesterase/phospholipase RssA